MGVKHKFSKYGPMALRGIRRWLRALCGAGAVLMAAAALAQSSGGDFEITHHTIDAGGGTSTAPNFELTGTIAQPEANAQLSLGGGFILTGGFLARGRDEVFSDGFEGN